MSRKHSSSEGRCEGGVESGRLTLVLSGRLDAETVGVLWPDIQRYLAGKGVQSVVMDGAGIEYCDGAGAALLVYIRRAAGRIGIPTEFAGLQDDIAAMLALYPADKLDAATTPARNTRDLVEEIGKAFVETLTGVREHIAFLGELTAGLVKTLFHPSGMRMKDFLLVAEASGARALPIIGMLGFLVGLIMAFQGAVLMAQFGAEIYIADFVGKSVARELGPLITAIIVAGRTGSAFAAEIGTMKVNEEIDAFTTMGLDPVRFLVVPRVTAATLMTPLLAVMTNLFGMAGGALVMKGLGFPLVTYVNRVLSTVTTTDFVSGLVKALVFGLLISSSGCLCGLRTREGASAVGNSATRAVVSSITMIVIADGVFAVLFYYMGV
jgi:phospholipid/cholesterol/gamma-HCH transport system permease protein